MPRFKNTSLVPRTASHGQSVAPGELFEIAEPTPQDERAFTRLAEQAPTSSRRKKSGGTSTDSTEGETQ